MPHLALADFDGLPAYVVALDGQGRIAFWNRRLEDATGIGRDAMLGQPGDSVLDGGTPAPLATSFGPPRLVRWRRSTESLPRGWTFAVGHDVTEDHAALEQILRSERLVAVGRLVGAFAHEVRNPLNSALLQMSLCERRIERNDLQPQGLVDPLRKSRAELSRIERLINDFLAFAQPQPLTLTPVDLSDLCVSFAQKTRPTTTVSIGVDAPLPVLILGDSARLGEVLLNLIANAIEAMPAGGHLTLRTHEHADFAHIDVQDTGVGVDLVDQKHVFDPFYSTKTAGTGLGLTIVHRIVTDHGGQVRLRSRPGDTCFTLVLPRAGLSHHR